VAQVIGDPMKYSGPIDLRALVDVDSLYDKGLMPFTFMGFPTCTVNEHGLPSDADAQRYIAAVQSAGVPVGIWLNSPIEGTGFAGVTGENISLVQDTLSRLKQQFPIDYVTQLIDRLFREASAGDT
jgi:hypothetical protein